MKSTQRRAWSCCSGLGISAELNGEDGVYVEISVEAGERDAVARGVGVVTILILQRDGDRFPRWVYDPEFFAAGREAAKSERHVSKRRKAATAKKRR